MRLRRSLFRWVVRERDATNKIKNHDTRENPYEDEKVSPLFHTQRHSEMRSIDKPRKVNDHLLQRIKNLSYTIKGPFGPRWKELSNEFTQFPSHDHGKQQHQWVELAGPNKQRQLQTEVDAEPPEQADAEAGRFGFGWSGRGFRIGGHGASISGGLTERDEGLEGNGVAGSRAFPNGVWERGHCEDGGGARVGIVFRALRSETEGYRALCAQTQEGLWA
jgi:hypothetical protein